MIYAITNFYALDKDRMIESTCVEIKFVDYNLQLFVLPDLGCRFWYTCWEIVTS